MQRERYILVPLKRKKTKSKRGPGRPKVITMKRLLGRGISRPYKDNNRLMLGSGKKKLKQTGGFFPLVAALSAATPIAELLTKIIR